MRTLNLNRLKDGTPGITKAIGSYVAQAAAYFLELQGHKSGVILQVSGHFEEAFELTWSEEIDETVKRSWRDSHEATEYAAVGIAALLTESLLGLTIVERSYIGNGVDYILGKVGKKETTVIYHGRMEVSGIGKETPANTVNRRIRSCLKFSAAGEKPAFCRQLKSIFHCITCPELASGAALRS